MSSETWNLGEMLRVEVGTWIHSSSRKRVVVQLLMKGVHFGSKLQISNCCVLVWILWNPTVHRKGVKFVGFEVLTAVVIKSTIFWDITPCGPLKANWRFGGTYLLRLQGRRISRTRNQQSSACHLLSRWFLARLILWPWRWRRYIPPKYRLIFNG
jgi:hypothetical protein